MKQKKKRRRLDSVCVCVCVREREREREPRKKTTPERDSLTRNLAELISNAVTQWCREIKVKLILRERMKQAFED